MQKNKKFSNEDNVQKFNTYEENQSKIKNQKKQISSIAILLFGLCLAIVTMFFFFYAFKPFEKFEETLAIIRNENINGNLTTRLVYIVDDEEYFAPNYFITGRGSGTGGSQVIYYQVDNPKYCVRGRPVGLIILPIVSFIGIFTSYGGIVILRYDLRNKKRRIGK